MWIRFSIKQKAKSQDVQCHHWHWAHDFASEHRLKGNIYSYNHPCSSSPSNNSRAVIVSARSLLEREQRVNKERWRAGEEKMESSFISLSVLSVLIRVSSAKPSGVSECMEAISTPHGRSQMPLISSWRLIHSDCKRSGWSHWPPHASQDSRHRGGNLHPSSRHPRWENVNGRGLS